MGRIRWTTQPTPYRSPISRVRFHCDTTIVLRHLRPRHPQRRETLRPPQALSSHPVGVFACEASIHCWIAAGWSGDSSWIPDFGLISSLVGKEPYPQSVIPIFQSAGDFSAAFGAVSFPPADGFGIRAFYLAIRLHTEPSCV
jgi:hypothetical protein